MQYRYVYTGQVDTEIPGVGIVRPNQEIVSRKAIANPLFREPQEPTTREIKKRLKIKTKK